MERNSFYLLVGTYTAGLLLSGWSWSWLGLGIIALVGAVASLRIFSLPTWPFWVMAGILGVAASPYLYLRTPRPAATDIRWLAPRAEIVVQGTVIEVSGEASQNVLLQLTSGQPRGRVAIRAPIAPRLVGGEQVRVTGSLARPQQPVNPQAFDFRRHLERQGVFAVLTARQVEVVSRPRPNWLIWIRGHILKVHQHHLGSEPGALFSSLIIGSDAVDLPKDLQERYRSVGLAHLLAASGAQVSLILGVCAALLSKARPTVQVALSAAVLGLFVCLAGASPSILRAALMGAVSLFALAASRKVQPLSALLLVAFGLLLYNPLWIFDLGFAFSFLATMGLIVTAPALTERLDALPTAIAGGLAVSVAASLWTLPLQLMTFGQWSPPGLLLNLLAMPAIEVLTIGGLFASTAALISPDLAGLIDLPLGAVLSVLDLLVRRVSEWSFSVLTPGVLLPVQAVLLYGLLVASHWQIPRTPILMSAVAVLFAPGLLSVPEVTLTVLANGRSEIVVIESRHRTFVLNGGSEGAVEHVLAPYLERRGRLVLDGAITLGSRLPETGGLGRLLAMTTVERLYDAVAPPWPRSYEQVLAQLVGTTYHRLAPEDIIELSPHARLRVLSTEPAVLLLEVFDERLLLIGNLTRTEQDWLLQSQQHRLKNPHWLWTSSRQLSESWHLSSLQGILSSGRGPFFTDNQLKSWSTDRHGALIWQVTATGSALTTVQEQSRE